MFSTGDYESKLAKRWIEFVKPQVPVDAAGSDQFGHSEYTHYYYGQVIYCMGEDGYAKLFPDSKAGDRLTWSKYKETFFEFLARRQNKDGKLVGHRHRGRCGPLAATSPSCNSIWGGCRSITGKKPQAHGWQPGGFLAYRSGPTNRPCVFREAARWRSANGR